METVVLAVVSLLALLFAVAFGFALWGAGRLRNLLSAKERELLRLQVELENARQVAAVKDEAARKLQGEKERFFAAAVDTLKEQFSNIALSQMKEHSEGLAKTNRTNMEGLLAPVRDQVKALQELAEKTRKETSLLGASMTKDVSSMDRIAKDLQGVAAALTSNTRFQGRKGEDVLAEKLRQAGLEEGVNFFLASSSILPRTLFTCCASFSALTVSSAASMYSMYAVRLTLLSMMSQRFSVSHTCASGRSLSVPRCRKKLTPSSRPA